MIPIQAPGLKYAPKNILQNDENPLMQARIIFDTLKWFGIILGIKMLSRIHLQREHWAISFYEQTLSEEELAVMLSVATCLTDDYCESHLPAKTADPLHHSEFKWLQELMKLDTGVPPSNNA